MSSTVALAGGDRGEQGVHQVERPLALPPANVEAGEVGDRFEGEAGYLRAQGAGAQVDVYLLVAPLPGQVGEAAVGGDQRGLVVYCGCLGDVAGARGLTGSVAQLGHPPGQRDAGRAGAGDEREAAGELASRIHGRHSQVTVMGVVGRFRTTWPGLVSGWGEAGMAKRTVRERKSWSQVAISVATCSASSPPLGP